MNTITITEYGDQNLIAFAIPGHPNYFADLEGNIYSTKTKKVVRLKPSTASGYQQVILMTDGRRVGRYIHQLMLETFHGPRPVEAVACHYPSQNRMCNRINNLSWNSREVNAQQYFSAEPNRASNKLSPETVREIRSIYARGGLSYRKIAAEYGCCPDTISHIVNRRTWKHLD